MKKLISISFLMVSILIFQNSYSQIQNLWGITAEGVNNQFDRTDLKNSLTGLPYGTTTRMVLYPNEDDPYTPNPTEYDEATEDIKSVSKIMAEILDSYAWAWYPWSYCGTGNDWEFDSTAVLDRLDAFLANSTFRNNVDIWEVGNEINAPWVYQGNTHNVMYTIDQALKHVKNSPYELNSNKTAITLYYYPSVDCVDDCVDNNPEPDSNYTLLIWAKNFADNFPDVIDNVDYVFVSYYWDAHQWGCSQPDTVSWDGVFCSLQGIFTNSIVGFGEVGWNDSISAEQKAYIASTYYRYSPAILCGPIGIDYTRACFYWNYVTDCLPDYENSLVWQEIYSAMEDYGNYGRPENDITNKGKDVKSKKTYELEQNYPNPFNPVTNIKFALHQSGKVKLTIYDILGREINTLVNEYKQSGFYSVNFNATNLASGVYIYKLQVTDNNGSVAFTDVKKMLVVK